MKSGKVSGRVSPSRYDSSTSLRARATASTETKSMMMDDININNINNIEDVQDTEKRARSTRHTIMEEGGRNATARKSQPHGNIHASVKRSRFAFGSPVVLCVLAFALVLLVMSLFWP